MKAFPTGRSKIVGQKKVSDNVYADVLHTEEGMDLRDYFAAKAMQSIILSSYSGKMGKDWDRDDWQDTVYDSYQIADAMMEAREQ